MKWATILLIMLISCAPATQEVVTKPVVQQPPTIEPQLVQEPQIQPPVTPKQTPIPAPQPAQQAQPKLSPEQQCAEDCQTSCAQTAQNSCTQTQRATCRDMCNDNPIIDPSACTQACAYLGQPNVCKQQMSQFCSAQCVGYCH